MEMADVFPGNQSDECIHYFDKFVIPIQTFWFSISNQSVMFNCFYIQVMVIKFPFYSSEILDLRFIVMVFILNMPKYN